MPKNCTPRSRPLRGSLRSGDTRSVFRLRRASPPKLGHCPCGARRALPALVVLRGAAMPRLIDSEVPRLDFTLLPRPRAGPCGRLRTPRSRPLRGAFGGGYVAFGNPHFPPLFALSPLGGRGRVRGWGDNLRCAATRCRPCGPKRSADGREAAGNRPPPHQTRLRTTTDFLI